MLEVRDLRPRTDVFAGYADLVLELDDVKVRVQLVTGLPGAPHKVVVDQALPAGGVRRLCEAEVPGG